MRDGIGFDGWSDQLILRLAVRSVYLHKISVLSCPLIQYRDEWDGVGDALQMSVAGYVLLSDNRYRPSSGMFLDGR